PSSCSPALPAPSSPCYIQVRKSGKHLHANDETWLGVLRPMLSALPDLSPTAKPCYVGTVFSELLATQDGNLSLFDDHEEKQRLASIVDALNRKHGEGAVTLGEHGERQVPSGYPSERRTRLRQLRLLFCSNSPSMAGGLVIVKYVFPPSSSN